MKRMLRFIVVGVVVLLVTYFSLNALYILRMKPKSVNTVSKLGHLRIPLLDFYNNHDAFPTALKDVGVDTYDVTDMVSGKPFRYFPKAENGVVLMQPEPFRTMFWPFGKMRQYQMRADGTIEDIYGTSK